MEKVSIIVPVYNAEPYLKRCLDSLLKQTFSNIEILLINDGSTDNSEKIMKEYVKKDKRVHFINQKHKGVSSARNEGLKKSTGDFITLVDADDFVEKNYVEILLENQRKGNYDVVLSYHIEYRENHPLKKKEGKRIELTQEEAIIEFFKGQKFKNISGGKLYKKEILKEIIYDEHMQVAEDVKILYEALKKSSKICIIKERIYYYFVRKGSASHSGFSPAYYKELEFWEELLKEKKYAPYNLNRLIKCILQCIMMKGIQEEDELFFLDKFQYYYPLLEKKSLKLRIKKIILSHDKLRKIYRLYRRKVAGRNE